MIVLSHSLTLYGFIITMQVVQGYILFAANMEDLKKMAKIVVPNNIVQVISQTPLNPDNALKPDRNDNQKTVTNNKKSKVGNVADGNKDSRENVKRTLDVTRFQDTNQYLIYQLAEKIKQRVMNELVLKFLNAKREKERRYRLKKTESEHLKVDHHEDDEGEIDEKTITDDETIIILKPIELSTERSKSGRTIKNEHMKHLKTEINYSMKKQSRGKITKDRFPRESTTTRHGRKKKTELKPMKEDFNGDISNKHKHAEKRHKIAQIDAGMNKINFYKHLVKKKTRSIRIWSVGAGDVTTYPNTPVTYVKLEDSDEDVDEGRVDEGKMEKVDDLIGAARYKIKNKDEMLKRDNNAKSDGDGDGDGGGEMKAVTSYLWFDDNANDTMIMTEGRESKADVLRNTMIPRQQRYSRTTPNYYGSLPTVVEKYNFKEPLPKRNRKRKRHKWVKKYP